MGLVMMAAALAAKANMLVLGLSAWASTLLFVPTAKCNGPKCFVNGPDFGAIGFMGPVARWIIGIILAVVILVGFVFGAFSLVKLASSNSRHKAADAVVGLGCAVGAVVLALVFKDLFVGLVQSASAA